MSLGGETNDLFGDEFELLAYLLEEEGVALEPAQAHIPPAPSGALPLSFAQERLWFLDRVTPGNPAYNIPAAIRCSGRLDVEALHRSINEIVRRHAALRTTFTTVDAQPVQQVADELVLPLPLVDLRSLAADEREQTMQALTVAEADLPFDLEQGPLLRAKLLWLDEQEYLLLICLHHIISDGWSSGVLMGELAALYSACASGQPPSLPALPIQYGDFAAWQRNWLQGDRLEQLVSYWKRQLAGLTPLELPTDYPRPVAQSFRGTTKYATFPLVLLEALRELSLQHNTTLFMVLVAAFNVVLHHHTRGEDIVIGTDVANRVRPETEPLIGFFVNQLVLRTDLSRNPSFQALLARVCEVVLGAYDHQDLPFHLLVDSLQLKRDLSRTPLFQVKLILQNAPRPPLELPGLTMRILRLESSNAVFDLSLFLSETAEGLEAAVRYNTDLFRPATIERLLEHFELVLQRIVVQPDVLLDELRAQLSECDREHQIAQERMLAQTTIRQLKTMRRKALDSAV